MRHYYVWGFKKSKRNKTEKSLFIETTLPMDYIVKAMAKCRYTYKSIIDLDASGKDVKEWKRKAEMVEQLDLFQEMRIIHSI